MVQNRNIIENVDEIAGLYQNLFFNEKIWVAEQIFRDWLKKPDWGYRPVEITDLKDILRSHLSGRETFGFYSHSEQGTCRWVCFDIDLHGGLLADRYQEVEGVLNQIRQKAHDLGIPKEAILLDFSGGKGIHLWILCRETPMETAQRFILHVQEGLNLPAGVKIDYFPNPTTNPEERLYGLPVKLPCGLHRRANQYSHFLDENLCGVVDVLRHLRQVVPCELPDLPPVENPKGIKTKSKGRKRAEKKKVPGGRAGASLPQPPLTPELSKLFSGCKLLGDFRKYPKDAGYWEWTYAGMTLAALGQEGADWFRHLSSTDQRRFDGSHESIIASVLETGEYEPPSCRKMGCCHCDCRSPFDHIGKERKRYRTWFAPSAASQETERVDIFSFQPACCADLKNMILGGTPEVVLNNMPLGAGKSTSTLKILRELDAYCLYYCPNHKLAKELAERLGLDALVVYGQETLEELTDFRCPHRDAIARDVQLGLSTGAYCGKKGRCKMKSTCAYLQQFERAATTKIVILQHAHLALGEAKRLKLMKGRQLLVLDESIVQSYRTEVLITRKHVENLWQALSETRSFADLKGQLNRLLNCLDSSNTQTKLDPFRIWPKEFGQVENYFRTNLPGQKNILRALFSAASQGLTFRKNSKGELAVHLPVHLPMDIPILILDATAIPQDYELLLSRPVRALNPASGRILKRFAQTIQMVGGGYSNSSLLTHGQLTDLGKRLVSFVQSKIRDTSDFGLICTKQLEDFLVAHKIFPAEKMLHYNALRGSNAFSKVRDLFILGYQGASYEDMARGARIAFDQDWDDSAEADKLKNQKAFVKLNLAGNKRCETYTLFPGNPHIRAYYNLAIRGEVEQALGRARIYADCGKTDRKVYLITNIPTSLEIDEVIDLRSETAPNNLLEAATSLLDEHGLFDRKQLAAKAGLSERYVRKKLMRLSWNWV